MRVLVVEDDALVAKGVEKMLRAEGMVVDSTTLGEDGLEIGKLYDYDIILLDLMLPDMDGYEVVRRIRERESEAGGGPRVPVIALTGMAGDDEKRRCLQAGMNDFLSKPFAVDQFIAKLQMYTGGGVNKKMPHPEKERRSTADKPVMVGEVFNEDEALKRAADDRVVLLERLSAFLQAAPAAIDRLRRAAAAGDDIRLFEQEVHVLKQTAIEIGATNIADESFSLLLQFRKKQNIGDMQGRIEHLAAELTNFSSEPRVRQLVDEARDPGPV